MSQGPWRDPAPSGKANLTEAELRSWVENLAPTNPARRQILKDLLRNANSDKMSLEDRQDCRKALEWVESDMVAERPTPIHRTLTLDELEAEQ